MDEFDKFKHKEVSLGSSILKCNDLLNLWLTKQENIDPYTQYDAQYVCLQSTQVDELCEWVQEMREKVQREGRKVLADLAQCSKKQVSKYNAVMNISDLNLLNFRIK